jgi:hypothetical protein
MQRGGANGTFEELEDDRPAVVEEFYLEAKQVVPTGGVKEGESSLRGRLEARIAPVEPERGSVDHDVVHGVRKLLRHELRQRRTVRCLKETRSSRSCVMTDTGVSSLGQSFVIGYKYGYKCGLSIWTMLLIQ